MVTYLALFQKDADGGFVVTIPDLPHGGTQGDNLAEAMSMARDFLKCVLQHYIETGEPIPPARKHRHRGYREVRLPALQSAKVHLYREFLDSGLKKAELARRIGIAKTNVDRLFDLDHASRLGQIEDAFRALGKQLELRVTSKVA